MNGGLISMVGLFVNQEHTILDNSRVFGVLSFANLSKELANDSELKKESYQEWLKSVVIKTGYKGELHFKIADNTFISKKIFDKLLNFVEKTLGYEPTEVLYKKEFPLIVVCQEEVVFVIAPKIIQEDEL